MSPPPRRRARSYRAPLAKRAGGAVAGLLLVGALACAASPPPLPSPEPWQAALGRDHPLAGRIWDVGADAFVTERELIDALVGRRFVLLGERHDQPDHHRLQARIVRALAAQGHHPALAFEMISSDRAEALAAAAGRGGATPESIRDAVDWAHSGWPDFALYAPVFAAGLDAGLPLVAANAPADTVAAVGRQGYRALPPARVAALGLDTPRAEAVQRAMAEEIRRAHCGFAPEERMGRMVDVQWLRDAWMAGALVEAAAAPGADGAVLIAGAGHVRRDRGVPLHLRARVPADPIASVAFVEVSEDARSPAEALDAGAPGVAPYDFAWFTPRQDDDDPCERFRDALEQMRGPR